jgi:hypothetical protein
MVRESVAIEGGHGKQIQPDLNEDRTRNVNHRWTPIDTDTERGLFIMKPRNQKMRKGNHG